MKAVEYPLLSVLGNSTIRFVVPVYQRNYAWEEKQWSKLWRDIIHISDNTGQEHFTGSIVWVGKMQSPGNDNEGNILVDGQQRLTTLSLIILAFAHYLRKHYNNNDDKLPVSYDKIVHYGYLLFTVEKGEQRYKLTLSDPDREIFRSLVEQLVDPDFPLPPGTVESRLYKALQYFSEEIEALNDPSKLWRGIEKLNIVNVMLDPEKDNPQLVFESMNAGGKPLNHADLIRNYLLLALPNKEQTKLYNNYWRQIELILRTDESMERFDNFIFHYLTLKLAPKIVVKKNLYEEFQKYKQSSRIDVSEILSDLLFHAKIYAKINNLEADENPLLADYFNTINVIEADPVIPLIMFLYSINKNFPSDLPEDTLIAAVKMLESYIVYRTLCDMPSNSLNKFIPLIIAGFRERFDKNNYNVVETLLATLESGKGSGREYPNPNHVLAKLKERPFYSMMRKRQKFFFEKIENSHHPKNPYNIQTGNFTIEHIMPQKINVDTDWPEMLGPDYENKYKDYLHLLGNLAITSFNSELGNMSFKEKKIKYKENFEDKSLYLLEEIQNFPKWDFATIVKRTEQLAEELLKIWPKQQIQNDEIESLSLIKIKGDDNAPGPALAPYLELGILLPNEKLIISDNSIYACECVLSESGEFVFEDGTKIDTPSGAVNYARKLKGQAKKHRNGWSVWFVPRLNCKLIDLKQKLKNNANTQTEQSDDDDFDVTDSELSD